MTRGFYLAFWVVVVAACAPTDSHGRTSNVATLRGGVVKSCATGWLTASLSGDRELAGHPEGVITELDNSCPRRSGDGTTQGLTCRHDLQVFFADREMVEVSANARAPLPEPWTGARSPMIVRVRCGGERVPATIEVRVRYVDEAIARKVLAGSLVLVVTFLLIRGYRAPGSGVWVKLDVRLALSLGGYVLASVLGVRDLVAQHAFDWRPGFTTVLVAFAFVKVARAKRFTDDLGMVIRHYAKLSSSPARAVVITTLSVFAVNIVVTSAAAASAMASAIFVPLLVRDLKIPAGVAVAAVMLGTWGGFLNPTDAGGAFISEVLRANRLASHGYWTHLAPVIIGLVILVCWLRSKVKITTGAPMVSGSTRRPATRVLVGALVVVLPLVLWIAVSVALRVAHRSLSQSNILTVAMSVAALVACLVSASDPGEEAGAGGRSAVGRVVGSVRNLGAGALKGFSDVVLLIFAAKVFSMPFATIIGVIPGTALVVVMALAFVLSLAIGSGDGIVTSLVGIVVPHTLDWGAQPGSVASMIWLGTELGRCASPISAGMQTTIDGVSDMVGRSDECGRGNRTPDASEVSRQIVLPLAAAYLAGCLVIELIDRVIW